MNKTFTSLAMVMTILVAGCNNYEPEPIGMLEIASKANGQKPGASGSAQDSPVPMGAAADFAVLAATTVTNDGESVITGDLGVSPGTAITGFQQEPANNIMGPGTVTAGLGLVNGTIYASGPVAAQAHADAVVAYDYLVAQTPDYIYSGVSQLDGVTFTPGVYSFAPSANLLVGGTMYLDFQGNNDAQFIFQTGSTLVTMAGSKVVALNAGNTDCTGANVYWAVGSSATIDGDEFIGTVIAHTTITMTYGADVAGRILALNGAVTMITNTISVCDGGTGGGESQPPVVCRDFVTGGGLIAGPNGAKATFGVSGGIKNDKFWGQLSYHDHGGKGMRVKSSSVASYTMIDSLTRQIEGVAKVNGKTLVTYTVTVTDNGEPGRDDSFVLELSNGYSAAGTLTGGGNIQLHKKCDSNVGNDKETYDDQDERNGQNN